MLGDFSLLEFYPRNWQAAFSRSMHPWLLHMSLWHFWFWFTFIFVMNLFFIFIFKSLTFQRVDIKGTRSVGDKRRIAWPEMLIVLIPTYWAINIITNALMYLRILESNGGYALLTVQVAAYQWGWKYCYGDTFYPKYFNSSIKVGYDSVVSQGGGVYNIFRDAQWNVSEQNIVNKVITNYITASPFINYREIIKFFINSKNKNEILYTDLLNETYFCRKWLKKSGILESDYQNSLKNQLFHSGYWLTAQGVDPNIATVDSIYDAPKLVEDPLRLLRSTGMLVLPTKNVFRLMSCSEDITHSWAVPGLGIKMDCVPGRLFCIITSITREGIYFGQCSELCGWNHYNMPVVLYAIPIEHFIIWWELELHNVFTQVLEVDDKKLNYSLLNLKYK